MINAKVEFTCSYCRQVVSVELEELEVIVHEASACSCEICGYSGWTEYKTNCPNCKKEVRSD
jgi:hypothetical protein